MSPEIETWSAQQEAVEVQVKVALLSIVDGSLLVAARGMEGFELPGLPPARHEPLDGIARLVLRELLGSDAGYVEQLYTFSFTSGETSEMVVSYLALVPGAPELAADGGWRPIAHLRKGLGETDTTVLDYALVRLRGKIGYTTIAFHLMAESFTLSDLQHIYETILDGPLDPRNFRRRIISSGLVQAENRQRRAGSHRPAALYRFAGNHDPASYLTPASQESGTDEEITMTKGVQ